jgi:UDPglucose 6-dehydrogenase
VTVYDPKVTEKQIKLDLISLHEEDMQKIIVNIDPYLACKGSHAIAILTEWDEFKTYDWAKIYKTMLKPAFVFDGRNLLDKKEMEAIGFTYSAVGSSNF